jgi:hypothetical protein
MFRALGLSASVGVVLLVKVSGSCVGNMGEVLVNKYLFPFGSVNPRWSSLGAVNPRYSSLGSPMAANKYLFPFALLIPCGQA